MCPTGSASHPQTTKKANLRSAFEVLDVDQDGKISHEDLRTFYGGFLRETSEDDVIETMMAAADSNRKGYVEYEEFERVLDAKKKKNGENGRKVLGVMEEAFKVMDRDGDGKVGHEDLKGYLRWAGLDATDEDVKAMIRLGGGDENGNGVSYEGLLKILAV